MKHTFSQNILKNKSSIVKVILLTLPVFYTSNTFAFSFSFADKIKEFFTLPGQKSKSEGSIFTDSTIDKRFYKSDCSNQYFYGPPSVLDENLKASLLYVCKTSYEIAYDEKKKLPLYATFIYRKETATKKDKELNLNISFSAEKDLPASIQNAPGKNSVSLVNPLGFMFNQKQFEETASYINTVNVTPQTQKLWNDLQKWTVDRTRYLNVLKINTGVLFLDPQNPNKVTHLYQQMIEPSIKEGLVFIIPNSTDIKGRNCHNNCNIMSFTTSMNELQKFSKIRFHKGILDNEAVRFKVSDVIAYKGSNN